MAETLATDWAEDGFQPQFSVEHTLADERWRIELARQG
jgi:hypothetical protein